MTISLAILGAAISTVGAVLGARRTGNVARAGQILVWTGYAISFASVLAFVAAGFLSAR